MKNISKFLNSSNCDFCKYLLQTLDDVKTICLCLKTHWICCWICYKGCLKHINTLLGGDLDMVLTLKTNVIVMVIFTGCEFLSVLWILVLLAFGSYFLETLEVFFGEICAMCLK